LHLLFPLLVPATGLLCGRLAMAGAVLSLVLLDGFLWCIGSASLDHVGPAGLVRCLCEFCAGLLAWTALDGEAWTSRALGEGCFAFGASALVVAVAIPSLQAVAPFGFVALVVRCVTGAAAPIRLAVVLAFPLLLLAVASLAWRFIERPCQALACSPRVDRRTNRPGPAAPGRLDG